MIMLKIRILALLISLVLTALTLYIGPKIYFAYIRWSDSLYPDQQQLINISQIFVGILIAVVGFWLWKRKARQK